MLPLADKLESILAATGWVTVTVNPGLAVATAADPGNGNGNNTLVAIMDIKTMRFITSCLFDRLLSSETH